MADLITSSLEPTDQQLIARWRAGDETAATALVHRHSGALARFVVAQGGGGGTVAVGGRQNHEVEEVVQDTFIRAFASLDSFRGDSSLRTWLFSIARNLLRDRIRSARARRPHVEIEEAHAVEEYNALDAAVADEAEGRVLEAVERLSPMQRSVFTLRVADGLSYKEIASALDTTEGAARVHYHNAMRAVKEYLDD